MKEILKSGATVEVSVADFATGWKLFCAVVTAYKLHGISLKPFETFNIGQMIKDNLTGVLEGFTDILTSEYVLELLWQCGKAAIYTKNNASQKITPEVFENIDNREDFLEAMYCVAKENLKPFFPKALMQSLATLGQIINTPLDR